MRIREGKDRSRYCITQTTDAEGATAFSVSVKRQGLVINKRFLAKRFPSEAAALAAAQAWRDRVLALLPPMTSKELRTLVRRNNTSGIPGVKRHTVRGNRTYWMAAAECAGKKVTRKFSVKRYGEEVAKSLAIEMRQKLMEANPVRYTVPTTTGQEVARNLFGDPDALRDTAQLVWDASAKTRFLAQLQEEGLIDPPPSEYPTGFYVVRVNETPRLRAAWRAEWRDAAGTKRTRTFSVSKYGAAEAERLARETHRTVVNRWRAERRLRPLPEDSPLLRA